MSIKELLGKNMNASYHLGSLFLDCMKFKSPETIFQIDAATGKKETYASILSRSISLAKALRQLGLQPGDVLALGGRNHLDLHVPYYAALLNGLPIVGVDPYFKYDEIKFLMKLTKPKIAFCENDTRETYERAARDAGVEVKIVTFHEGDFTMNKLMDKFDDDSLEEFQPAVFDLDKIYAWLISTSGTTGRPKVAAFKHKVLISSILLYLQGAANKYANGTYKGLNLAPVQWISAYFNAVGFPLLGLCKVQTSRADDIGHIIDIINEYKPVIMMISPSTISRILKHEKPCNFSCLDSVTITGAKIHKELIMAIKEHIGPNTELIEAYGQTETIGPSLRPNPAGPLGNCGVPMPAGIRQIKLVDPETGDEVSEPNVPGELWCKGPSFTEYYNNPQETAEAFTEDGWLKTGDLLYRDEHHNYFFVDRLKQLIKFRNRHVYPNELEEVIVKMPGVLEVCVVGVPHAEAGQVPAACVVRRRGADVTAHQVMDLVASKLSDHKHLRGGVIFMDSLPKTSTGKLARKVLMDIVLETRTKTIVDITCLHTKNGAYRE